MKGFLTLYTAIVLKGYSPVPKRPLQQMQAETLKISVAKAQVRDSTTPTECVASLVGTAVFKTVEGSKESWLVRFLPTPPLLTPGRQSSSTSREACQGSSLIGFRSR